MKLCPQCQIEYADEVDFCPSDGTKLRSRRESGDDPLIGRALDGRWVIEEKLGEGGMGAVYRGHQKSVSRTVAIKTLRPQLVDSDEFVDRFFREAKIAATISHPNSVTILDYGESEDGTLYLAMEFLDGDLLTDRIEAGNLGVREVLQIGMQVASALSAAHDNHIVHRDLKPDNIFLLDVPGGGTFIKVLDFGIAKMLDSKTQVTKTGMIFGTPEYMSPEQCRGDKIDGRSDLYSLGCIMYELVGGRTPFKGTTPMAVLMAHVNQAAPALPHESAPEIPADVDRVIMRLLEKNPADRFASAEELRETLEAVLHSLDSTGSNSQQLVQPPPSRQTVAPEVNMGFDETMGMASTGPTPPVDERRERPHTDAMAPAAKPPFAILFVLLLLIAVASAAIAWVLTSSGDSTVAETTPTQTIADPAAVAEAPPVVEPSEPAALLEAVPDAGTAAAPTDESAREEVAVAEPTKPEPRKKRTKKRKPEPEPEVKVEDKPDPKPEPVATKEEPKPKSDDKPKSKDKGKEKPKPKDDPLGINKKAEKIKKDIGKGIEKGLENTLDGLLN